MLSLLLEAVVKSICRYRQQPAGEEGLSVEPPAAGRVVTAAPDYRAAAMPDHDCTALGAGSGSRPQNFAFGSSLPLRCACGPLPVKACGLFLLLARNGKYIYPLLARASVNVTAGGHGFAGLHCRLPALPSTSRVARSSGAKTFTGAGDGALALPDKHLRADPCLGAFWGTYGAPVGGKCHDLRARRLLKGMRGG